MSPLLPSMGPEAYGFLMILAVTPVLLYAQQPPTGRERESGGWRDALALGAVALLALVLMKHGVYTLLVATGSMEPTINPGDIVVVTRIPPSKVGMGDVVAYVRGDGSVVLHRVIAVERRGHIIVFTTKGDANQEPDKPWNNERLLGRLALRIPRIGAPMLWAAETTGTIFAAPALAAAATTIAAAAKHSRAWKRRGP